MVRGQGVEFGTREHIIQTYEGIIERWDSPDSNMKEILPEKYHEICTKLEGLKAGEDFKLVDRTKDLAVAIAYIAGQVPGINVKNTKEGKQFIDTDNGISYKDAKECVEELNTSLGGRLYQHQSNQMAKEVQHDREAERD